MDRESIRQRMRIALELFELGEQMLRQRLRREQPGISDAEVEAHVRRWLATRPGAEHGDSPGVPVPWPRPAR